MAYILSENRIIPSLQSISRDGVLKELAELAAEVCPDLPRGTVLHCLQNREKLGSTGVGNGIALPHCHLSFLDRTEFFLARSMEGLSFGAYDGKPTHIFFLILAPEFNSLSYLKNLGQLTRFLKDPEIKRRILNSHGAGEIMDVVNEAERY
ncbi:MAG: PTS sugar transporter subunit IIA [Desulfurivibrionaceae bacterium]